MTARYEFWLCDDRGVRIHLLSQVAFVSYTRSVKGIGYIEIGFPFEDFKNKIPSIFTPDWRIDVWRSPIEGVPARREGSFLLRKFITYTRQEDNMRMLVFYGRSPIDILRRQFVDVDAKFTLTDYADDMMKQLVSDYVINAPSGYETVPTGEMTVEGDVSDGPSLSQSFFLDNILDALKNIQEAVETLNFEDSSNLKVYFDVQENDGLLSLGFGYTFRTYVGLRGADRTTGILFSEENGNIKDPNYSEDYNDQITSAHVVNENSPASNADITSLDSGLSRWNMVRLAQTSNDNVLSINQTKARTMLGENKATKKLNVKFINSPGGIDQPHSLYGVDWDLGDLLQVKYSNKVFTAEVLIIYISLNESGVENIVGLNTIGE